MKILLVAATPFELAPTLEHLETQSKKKSFLEFHYRGLQIFPLITGVGGVRTAFAMARFSNMEHIDLAINIGVAGSFNRATSLGTVIEVKEDRFADLGVEEKDGDFTDVYEMGLAQSNDYLHSNGWIINDSNAYESGLEQVRGISVNKVHGTQESVDQIYAKYKADIESMEGAAFFYACKHMDVHCLQVRGISNYVEARNRESWELEKAITQVNKFLKAYLNRLSEATSHTRPFGH